MPVQVGVGQAGDGRQGGVDAWRTGLEMPIALRRIAKERVGVEIALSGIASRDIAVGDVGAPVDFRGVGRGGIAVAETVDDRDRSRCVEETAAVAESLRAGFGRFAG